jgi:hypothetical protein
MKKLAIFYHLFQTGEWAQIFTNQIIKLQASGLYDAADYIFIGVNGNYEMPFILEKVDNYYHNKTHDQKTEYFTLKALYDYSCLTDSNVLFLHGKGVTWSTEETKNTEMARNVRNWKKYLEYFTIERWRECVDLLETYDCVGTEWVDEAVFSQGKHKYKIPHYAGGIWWATSDYIKTLNPNFITNNMILSRFASELWIGTNNPKYYNFWNSNRNLYHNELHEHEYKMENSNETI